MKILIADDDLTTRTILQAIITKWGFQPLLAEDGNAAWEELQQDDPPRILLLDWEMPKLSGLELCQLIRQQTTEDPPYIILLTARSKAEDIAEGLESGANDFIVKPFKNVELKARVNVAKRVIQLQSERLESLAKAQLAASVFTHALEGIVITDKKGLIINVNKAFSDITGYRQDEAVQQHSRSFLLGQNQGAWKTIKAEGKWLGEVNNTRKNGDNFSIQLAISAVYNSNGQIDNYIGLFSDITASKQYKQKLEYAASHDGLTKLANRTLLRDRLEQAIAQVRRGAKPLAVVYLDLDGFKSVNDKFGHDQGDQLLITLANQLNKVVRETDTVARIGGDEFVIILTGLSSQEGCELTLWRLLAAAITTVGVNGQQAQVSASIGVSFFSPGDTLEVDELFNQADTAMYNAKNSGKNCFQFFEQKKLSYTS